MNEEMGNEKFEEVEQEFKKESKKEKKDKHTKQERFLNLIHEKIISIEIIQICVCFIQYIYYMLFAYRI